MAQGYGREMWCTTRLLTARFATGIEVVRQAFVRRLITPRGDLVGGELATVYGLDLCGFVGRNDPDRVRVILPGMVEAELLKDDRASVVRARVSDMPPAGGGLVRFRVDVDVTLHDPSQNFRFTIAIDALTIDLLPEAPV